MARRIFFLVLLITWLAANLVFGSQWRFYSFGNLGGDDGFGKASQALGISGDGRFVVGDSLATAGLGVTTGTEALLWIKPVETAKAVKTRIGTLSTRNAYSSAKAVSLEGRVVVGAAQTDEGKRAFRWSQPEGIQSLGVLPGHDESVAWGVSGNGKIIVGESSSLEAESAFRWESGKMVALADLPGNQRKSSALAVSLDGRAIVGYSRSSKGTEAVVWRAGEVMSLGSLGGTRFGSRAFAVSADGNVIVGVSLSPRGTEAFRWTRETGMQPLGDLPGGEFQSKASGVSADGNTIVGSVTSENGSEAFIWTKASGLRSLGQLLQANGLAKGWRLQEASGVSNDGNVVIGIGQNPAGETSGWIAELR